MGINKPETHEVVETNEKKERSNFAPESVETKTQRETAEQEQTVDDQSLDEILESGYSDAPAPRPSTAVREQFSVNAEKLITTTNQQIAKKFGPTAFARWNPEQYA